MPISTWKIIEALDAQLYLENKETLNAHLYLENNRNSRCPSLPGK